MMVHQYMLRETEETGTYKISPPVKHKHMTSCPPASVLSASTLAAFELVILYVVVQV